MLIFETSKYGMLMINDSETFRPITSHIDVSGGFTDVQLIRETVFSRLFRAKKAGKYFMIKTTKDNSGMQFSMLRREYEMSLRMSHNHIATVYCYENDTPVGEGIVMNYIEGRSLSDFLQELPSQALRERVFRQILDAVAYIHRCGVIHNDLKPENILITRTDNDVKIIDFGLSEDDAHYLAHSVGGTRGYASPELLNRKQQVDTRSDIYSLGVIMKDIFGSKYNSVASRSMKLNLKQRYRNVDELKRAWELKRKMPRYAGISALVVMIVGMLVYLFAGHIGQRNKELSVEDYRTRLYATIDSLLEQNYKLGADSLEKVPYYEFTHYCVYYFSEKCAEVNDSLRATIPLSTGMIGEYDGYWGGEYARWYEKLFVESQAKPRFAEMLKCDTPEYRYYINLLNDGQPYAPYKP